ncbi:MAG: succinate dehydrogenase iron-sulfur subunit [Candidatus Melainabacteria bacterium]|jgi:succinate dehydrogenase / fumarate reductase iron-sulfur subunit
MSNIQEKKTVKFKIKRQITPDSESFWEEYEIPWKPSLNIITVLMAQHESPTTCGGKISTPASYDANCLEEVCGSCTMVINGKARQACTALVDKLEQPITIEPMTKFPIIRDLMVNRDRMFEQLKWVEAWSPIDSTVPVGPGSKVSPEDQEKAYNFASCMTCGCCLESCPQWSADEGFIGPQAIAQAVLFNRNPIGKNTESQRVQALIDNGLNICGNAQNCAAVCPKEVDLVGAISEANWQATKHIAKQFLGGRK